MGYVNMSFSKEIDMLMRQFGEDDLRLAHWYLFICCFSSLLLLRLYLHFEGESLF